MASEFDELIRLLRRISPEAVPAAENAAAKVYQAAAIAAAPRRTGQLAGSIKIIEGKYKKALTSDTARRRLFVGPEKKRGYYGYWGEKGRGGFSAKKKRTLSWVENGVRIFRKSVGPQRPRPWFYAAIRAADDQAAAAAEAAFNAKLEELDKKG